MKAWLLDDYRGVGSLRIGEVPDPRPEPGDVVLRLLYAGLNPADSYLALRQYPARPSLPHILGRDGVGIVVEIGKGVRGLRIGQQLSLIRGEVGSERPGTFAEKVSVPAECLTETPTHWSAEESAGAVLVYLTAYQALTTWGPLPENAKVLITGASGGVGVAAVQLAVAMGYRVIALSRSPEKGQRLLQMGATAWYDPNAHSWRQDLRSAYGRHCINLAVDNVGGWLLPQVIEVLADQGKVSLVGRLAGPVPEFNTATLFFRRLRMGGIAVGAYSPQEARVGWQNVLSLLAKTGAKPVIDSIFAFEKLPEAFRRLEQGPFGKVLLRVAPPDAVR